MRSTPLPTVEYAGVPHSDTYLQYMHSPQWNMQCCPTVVLVYMHSPQVEYAGVPHSGTRLYARPQWAETDQRDAMGTPEY
jgi:hypothetical protein